MTEIVIKNMAKCNDCERNVEHEHCTACGISIYPDMVYLRAYDAKYCKTCYQQIKICTGCRKYFDGEGEYCPRCAKIIKKFVLPKFDKHPWRDLFGAKSWNAAIDEINRLKVENAQLQADNQDLKNVLNAHENSHTREFKPGRPKTKKTMIVALKIQGSENHDNNDRC